MRYFASLSSETLASIKLEMTIGSMLRGKRMMLKTAEAWFNKQEKKSKKERVRKCDHEWVREQGGRDSTKRSEGSFGCKFVPKQ